MSSVEAAATDDVTTQAGRGTVYITASKLWFMVTGAAIVFVLPRQLTPEQYGLYNIVIALVSTLNDVVVKGTSQTVSKFVSQAPGRAGDIKRKAILLQCVLGGGAAALFALAAPLVADWYNDRALTEYLRLAALITASYAFYAVFVGVLNGRKEFLKQATLDAFYSTSKLFFIVALTVAGFGVAGAISGFALAVFAVLVAAAVVAGVGGRAASSPVGFKQLLQFQFALILFLLVNNLLMRADLFLVKKLIDPDPTAASAAAGIYAAVLNFAYISFQIILSITFVIFPLVSEATFKADFATARGYIRQTIRATLIISALPAVLLSANAAEVLGLIYPEPFVAGAPALRTVALGMLAFAVISILTTVISSGGKPWISVALVAGTLLLDVVLNVVLIPRLGLAGAALATTIAMTAGALACALYVRARYGGVTGTATIARVGAASIAVYALALLLPSGELFARMGMGRLAVKGAVAFEFVLLGVVYLALLFALREIGREEVRLVRRIAGI